MRLLHNKKGFLPGLIIFGVVVIGSLIAGSIFLTKTKEVGEGLTFTNPLLWIIGILAIIIVMLIRRR